MMVDLNTNGKVLAAALGDAYPTVFAEVTGTPLWSDEAPLRRTQRKWEAYAARVIAAYQADTRTA